MPPVTYYPSSVCMSIHTTHFIVNDQIFRSNGHQGSFERWDSPTGSWKWSKLSMAWAGHLYPLARCYNALLYACWDDRNNSWEIRRASAASQSDLLVVVLGKVPQGMIHADIGISLFLVSVGMDGRLHGMYKYDNDHLKRVATVNCSRPDMLRRGTLFHGCIYSYKWPRLSQSDPRYNITFTRCEILRGRAVISEVVTDVLLDCRPEREKVTWIARENTLYCIIMGNILFEIDTKVFNNGDVSLIRYCFLHSTCTHTVQDVNEGAILVSAVRNDTHECMLIYVTLGERMGELVSLFAVNKKLPLQQKITSMADMTLGRPVTMDRCVKHQRGSDSTDSALGAEISSPVPKGDCHVIEKIRVEGSNVNKHEEPMRKGPNDQPIPKRPNEKEPTLKKPGTEASVPIAQRSFSDLAPSPAVRRRGAVRVLTAAEIVAINTGVPDGPAKGLPGNGIKDHNDNEASLVDSSGKEANSDQSSNDLKGLQEPVKKQEERPVGILPRLSDYRKGHGLDQSTVASQATTAVKILRRNDTKVVNEQGMKNLEPIIKPDNVEHNADVHDQSQFPSLKDSAQLEMPTKKHAAERRETKFVPLPPIHIMNKYRQRMIKFNRVKYFRPEFKHGGKRGLGEFLVQMETRMEETEAKLSALLHSQAALSRDCDDLRNRNIELEKEVKDARTRIEILEKTDYKSRPDPMRDAPEIPSDQRHAPKSWADIAKKASHTS